MADFKQRIAFFLPSLEGGGAERVMLTLANAMAKRGYCIDLLLASAKGSYLKDVGPGVNLIDLKVGRVIKALFPLRQYLKNRRPTALISALTHANLISIAANFLSGHGSRLIISVHSTISLESKSVGGFLGVAEYKLIPFMYSLADCVCAVSDAVAVDLASFGRMDKKLIKTIYNPFDLPAIMGKASECLDHPWFLPGEPPVILAIGRLISLKGFDDLIRAFSLLRASRSVRLLILGEGEQRSRLETLASELKLRKDDVIFPGFVDNPFKFLAKCGVFVLSSKREGLPSVLIEALACGAAVVSTDCPHGPREILEDGRWGTLVPVGDVVKLAQAISETLDTPLENRPDVKQRALRFSQDIAVKEYLNQVKI